MGKIEMLDKRSIVIVIFILVCTSFQAAIKTQLQSYFIDSESDIASNNQNTIMVRSFETKVFTLDMLYTSIKTRRLFLDLDLKYFYKQEKIEIDPERKNKFGLIIDLSKAKHSTLDIYNDAAYMEYFRNADRSDILNYLMGLNENNEKNIPAFIIESASYFNNKEFYSAYADYLPKKSKISNDELINLYLHGGDFISAANLLDSSKKYSSSQRVKILELAQRFGEAYELCLKTDSKNQKRLSQLATLSGRHEDAYQHYLQFDPNANQVLAQLSYATGDFQRALVHARQNPLNDEFLLDLFVKTSNNYEAFILAVKTNSSMSDSLFVSLSEIDKTRASDYYADKGDFIFAYELRKKANLHQNIDQSLREGIDAQLGILAKDPYINLKESVEAALGTKAQTWSKENAGIVTFIVTGKEHDLGYYYDLCDKNDLAYQYYLDTHQYIKAIDYHQQHLQNTNIPISETAYTRAGIEAENKNQNELAVSYYKLGGSTNYQRISELYRGSGDYDQAISYQLQADPNANQTLAELYEKKTDYANATRYYLKAGMYTKSAAVAELISTKDYRLLVESNHAAGNTQNTLVYLNELFNENSEIAGDYYKRIGEIGIYRDKCINAGKYTEALSTYDPNETYSDEELDFIIDVSRKANDRSKEIIFTSDKLKKLSDRLDNLTIHELDGATKLADLIDDAKYKLMFSKAKKNYNDRIYGVYVGTQPSSYLKGEWGNTVELFGEAIELPASQFNFKLNKDKTMRVLQKSEGQWVNDVWGNTSYSESKTWVYNGTYSVIKNDDIEFIIKYNGKCKDGDLKVIMTINKSELSGECESSSGDINFPSFSIDKQ
jgi:hypothetical protein